MMIEILLGFIPNIYQFLIILILYFISIFAGYIFVYNPTLRWNQFEALNILPFSCQKCFTFWFNLIINIFLAYLWDWHFVVWGIITASSLAYMLWYNFEKE